jgi:hypothetical protein
VPIAPSTYYDQVNREPSRRQARDEVLKSEIVRLHAANYGVYGARKVWLALNRKFCVQFGGQCTGLLASPLIATLSTDWLDVLIYAPREAGWTPVSLENARRRHTAFGSSDRTPLAPTAGLDRQRRRGRITCGQPRRDELGNNFLVDPVQNDRGLLVTLPTAAQP